MSKITLDTSGLDLILRDMKKNKAQALEEIGARVERRAKELVPVDTGFLRSSINHQVAGNVLHINADADYASFIEFGTMRMTAQPYLLPAVREVQPQIPSIMANLATGRIRGLLRNLVNSVRTWIFD